MSPVKDKVSPPGRLLRYDEIEQWRQFNPYITTSYRPLSNSYRTSLVSISSLHNQTVNIWTHLLAFAFFVTVGIISFATLSSRYSSAGHEDIVVFTSFFAGALLCFAFSSFYHIFHDHSENVNERWLLLDFVGIVAVTAGSWVPGVYYGWYCKPDVSRSYTSFVSAIVFSSSNLFALHFEMCAAFLNRMLTLQKKILSLAFGCTLTCVIPAFRDPRWQNYNTAMFSSLGIFGFIPMAHAAMSFGVAQAHKQMGWWWFILEGVFYLSGLAIFSTRYPERVHPGRYDHFGASHQIFHVLVFGGALSHLIGIIEAFNYNHHPKTRLCDPWT